jgi:Zn-dependent peptidase ImmA (M78 family)
MARGARSALRRGFKSETNTIARSARADLGLRADAPLDPWVVAEVLDITLLALSDLADEEAAAVLHLTSHEPGAFSAVTIFDGVRRLIVYNDAHSRERQASDLAHELAHALLQHRPHAAFDAAGCRDWRRVEEEEAEWLAGALLVSDEAALTVVRRGLTVPEAAAAYGVSESMMRFRLNMTGARRRVPARSQSPALPQATA